MSKQSDYIIGALMLIIALASYCSYKILKYDKPHLDAALIWNVGISKASPFFYDSAIYLTRPQIEDFVNKWNNSRAQGDNQYQCQYSIQVSSKFKGVWIFCTSGNFILEGNRIGHVYLVGGVRNYFDSIYEMNRK